MKLLQFSFPLLFSFISLSCMGAVSEIRHVELYPSGATVVRTVAIEATTDEGVAVEIENLPSSLLPTSVQIAAPTGSGLRIGGFAFSPQENPVEADDPRTQALRDSLKEIDRKMQVLRQEQSAVDARIRYYEGLAEDIRASLKEKAGPESFKLAQQAWKDAEATRKSGQEETLKITDKLDALKLERDTVQKDLNELVNDLKRLAGVLKFDLEGNLSTGAELVVRYQVREAGWAPVHEVRADPAGSKVEWVYKARVHQNTGEDWNGVNLSLNSASALYAGGLPDLPPLFLSRSEGVILSQSKARAFSYEMLADAAPPMEAEVASTTTGFYISLNRPVSVESGEPPVVREAVRGTIGTEFWTEVVPALSTEAWLVGGLTNDLGYPLLSGELFCYIDGQLVSRRHMDGIPVGEEVELALGRNEKVVVERIERLRKESEGGLIDKTKRHDIKYETKVTNRMPVAHRVVLQDRFPVGRDNKIQVRTVSPRDVEPEEGTGLFKWERTIEPGMEAVMITEYSVIYPAEWTVLPKP